MFTFQTIQGLPKSVRRTEAKYDWSAFPAPVPPATEGGETTYSWADVMAVSQNTILGSIKKFRQRQKREGRPEMAFRTETIVADDATKKVLGIRVYRIK